MRNLLILLGSVLLLLTANAYAVDPGERLTDQALRFCGMPDFIGVVEIRRGCGLIDWKTSLGIEPWFRLQGAAYRHLAGVNGMRTDWGGNLRLKADGGMPLFTAWPDDFGSMLNVFMCALQVYWFFKG